MTGRADYTFDRSVFGLSLVDGYVTLNYRTVPARNIQTTYAGLEYFEFLGTRYEYAVNLWNEDKRVEICVSDKKSGRWLSVINPRNQQELLQVIDTILRDFKQVLAERSSDSGSTV